MQETQKMELQSLCREDPLEEEMTAHSSILAWKISWTKEPGRLQSSVQFSHVLLFATPWTAARQASLSIINFYSLLKLMSIQSVMPSNHLILSSPSPAFNLSQHQGLFKWVSSSHQVAKILELHYQSFQWIFRTDLLYNWPVGSPCSPRDSQESYPTPKSKVSILRCSAFFTVQLSHPYMDKHTRKIIALTRCTFVGK